MSTWRTIIQVDAFTATPCTGNAAAVVPDAGGLDPVQMQRIAREMNLSETAFILPSDQADFRLRWWTPTVEVPLCGHATVAACHALAELGRLAVPGAYRIETASGVLAVALEPSPDGPCQVWLDIPIPAFEASALPLPALAGALRVDERSFVADMLPVRGGDYLYLAFNKLTELLSLRPDLTALEYLSHAHDVRGFACWTRGGVSPESALHLRFFAPAVGIA
ncbi:MAG TPA: PhzF family phenazine biosynthesis protein, partial [Herpetosiphonaceae bacterium]